MGDLIDRDALCAELNRCVGSPEGHQRLMEVNQCICDAPAVDAAPVVHGRLLRTDAYPHRLYCSNCYHTIVPNEEMVPLYNMTINYCLHCGAKFDGGEV